jgi:hypothetical protein
MPARIVECRALAKYRVWLRFESGESGEVDLSHLAGKGVFVAWNTPGGFESVCIDQQSGTVCWPGGIDLDPDVLLHRISGAVVPGNQIESKSPSAA